MSMRDIDIFPGVLNGPVIVLMIGDEVEHKIHGRGIVTSTFPGGAFVLLSTGVYERCSSDDLYLRRGR